MNTHFDVQPYNVLTEITFQQYLESLTALDKAITALEQTRSHGREIDETNDAYRILCNVAYRLRKELDTLELDTIGPE